jgi:hypothetical protein
LADRDGRRTGGHRVADDLRRDGQRVEGGRRMDGQRVEGGRRMGGQRGADGLQRDGLREERGQNFGCWGERMRVAERHQTLQSQDVHFVRQAASQRAWAWAHLVRRWAVVCVNSRCKGSVLAN